MVENGRDLYHLYRTDFSEQKGGHFPAQKNHFWKMLDINIIYIACEMEEKEMRV